MKLCFSARIRRIAGSFSYRQLSDIEPINRAPVQALLANLNTMVAVATARKTRGLQVCSMKERE
jgi:hypothetical protein